MKDKLINIEEIEFVETNDQQYILGGIVNSKIESVEKLLRTIYYPDNTIS